MVKNTSIGKFTYLVALQLKGLQLLTKIARTKHGGSAASPYAVQGYAIHKQARLVTVDASALHVCADVDGGINKPVGAQPVHANNLPASNQPCDTQR
jgi:hypothetical protein